MATYRWRFGVCTSSVFGAVTVDVTNLPRVQVAVTPFTTSLTLIGASKRALDGTMRTDRFAMKRTWSLVLGHWETVTESWPVMRLFGQSAGPWMFYDHSRPNLLSGPQRLMQAGSWTDASGITLTARGDGAVSVAAGGVAQMGPSSGPSNGAMVPVAAGATYFAAMSVRGASGWTVTPAVAWFDGVSAAPLSVTTLPAATATSALSSVLVLDGTVTASRVGGSAVAPTGAMYGQLRVAVSGAAVDVSDPVLLVSPADPGHAMHVVNIDTLGEQFEAVNTTSLTMTLSEI